ncbi:GAF domain-containing protein [Actinoallomurus rhizosphaericola]|uniref:GAF domain-containing protein n=1 Tax=Actinoallomurus rhizosphaericola TaxID=2952536 RepID=UPI002090E31F|nr:GAF domain-containing protein [Actinoallomurus rhizosphaericola]MCO5992242.1 GAF domain-containing protein [Actinoallomurus rhizosphaericola]
MRSSHVCDNPADCGLRTAVLHEAAVAGPARTDRPLIRESWRRSLDAGVDPDMSAAPQVIDAARVADVRAAHPLDRHLPQLRDTLRRVADATTQLMVITDGDARVLWSEGPSDVRRHADAVGLIEGFRWSEEAIGTNGIGTALSTRAPAYVQATEHLVRVLQPWSCAGAPVVDPDTDEVIGCVDISATVDALHPAVVALVEAAARLAEAWLTMEMNHRDECLRARYLRHVRGDTRALVTTTGRILAADPDGWRGGRVVVPEAGGRVALPDGRTAVAETLGQAYLLRAAGSDDRCSLTLRLLGDEQPCAFLDGRRVPLSLRHAELLALLALHPNGLTCEQSSLYLYGDEGNPVTLRAEIHRLRGQLGNIVRAKPYRLDCEVEADFLTVRRLLAAGDVTAAVRLYPGPLLPRSESPAVQAERDELTAQLRRQLLHRGDLDALWCYAQAADDDLEVLTKLAAVLPPGDPRRVSAQLRRERVLRDD